MNRHDLEHLIRSASEITDAYELVIIGSQSIHGKFPDAPSTLQRSDEADMFVEGDEHASDVIDATIGELSQFHETHGYYAQGVGIETAALPAQWRSRLIKIQNENTDLRVGYCIHPTDLAAAKLAAGRERDWPFVSEMLFHGLVLADELGEALRTVPEERLPPRRIDLLRDWIARQGPLHAVWRAEAEARMKNLATFQGVGGIREALLVELSDHTIPADLSKFNADAVHKSLLEQASADGDNATAAGLELKGCSPWGVRPLEQEILDSMAKVLARPARTSKPK